MDDLRHILLLDIETVACVPAYGDLSERMKTQWGRKASFFRNRLEGITDEDLFRERAGIYAEFGKIIVIAIGKYTVNEQGERGLKTRVFAGHDEKALLEEFCAMVNKMDQQQVKLCAHNGKEFDFPYLSRRLLIHGMRLPGVLSHAGKKPWEVNHLDTMEMWKFGDYKHYTSLDLLAALFNIPTSKGELDGSKVNEVYYQSGEVEKIADYCRGDVVAIGQLLLRLRGQPVIPEHLISHT